MTQLVHISAESSLHLMAHFYATQRGMRIGYGRGWASQPYRSLGRSTSGTFLHLRTDSSLQEGSILLEGLAPGSIVPIDEVARAGEEVDGAAKGLKNYKKGV